MVAKSNYPLFKHHLVCNLYIECQDRSDEFLCPHTSSSCKGAISIADKCFELQSRKISMNGLQAELKCRIEGKDLASFPHPGHLKTLISILQYYNLSVEFWIGLKLTEVTHPNLFQYKHIARWENGVQAFHVDISHHGLVCVYDPGRSCVVKSIRLPNIPISLALVKEYGGVSEGPTALR